MNYGNIIGKVVQCNECKPKRKTFSLQRNHYIAKKFPERLHLVESLGFHGKMRSKNDRHRKQNEQRHPTLNVEQDVESVNVEQMTTERNESGRRDIGRRHENSRGRAPILLKISRK